MFTFNYHKINVTLRLYPVHSYSTLLGATYILRWLRCRGKQYLAVWLESEVTVGKHLSMSISILSHLTYIQDLLTHLTVLSFVAWCSQTCHLWACIVVFGHLTASKIASTVTGPHILSAPRYNKSHRPAIQTHCACVTDWSEKPFTFLHCL